MSEARKPFLIGAFLLAGLALLAAGVLLLSRDSWFSQPSEYVVYFTGALDGLAGVVIGKFTKCDPGEGNYGTLTLDPNTGAYTYVLDTPFTDGVTENTTNTVTGAESPLTRTSPSSWPCSGSSGASSPPR